jgi:L-ascorbate metabolism protein UlaG (beta-lactamase superfamily)
VDAKIRFLGVAGYEILTTKGARILIDPFLDENPGSTLKSQDFHQVDLILVSHAAYDHLGDTEALARRTGAPVVCGGEVKAYLLAKGIPETQIRATVWGIALEIAGFKVVPVECHHWSQIRLPGGQFASGVPLGFVIYIDEKTRFYHYGDTSLFSDLKLIADLHKPTIGCVGITNPLEIEHSDLSPGRMLTAEMSPREGAKAAEWLGLETVLPCHYINPDCEDVREFQGHLDEARRAGRKVPNCVVLRPGDWIDCQSSGLRGTNASNYRRRAARDARRRLGASET